MASVDEPGQKQKKNNSLVIMPWYGAEQSFGLVYKKDACTFDYSFIICWMHHVLSASRFTSLEQSTQVQPFYMCISRYCVSQVPVYQIQGTIKW